MDYPSYKAMCDSTLEQIRKSECKREELNNKLQKMYKEKSECEKSIIKTLETRQKQFMEEKRRRAERNENILRTLERIDYQAQLLAAKTERLRALKKQYERYLLSLWATRRVAVYPAPSVPLHTYARPLTAKYEEVPIHQSSYCEAGSNYHPLSAASALFLPASSSIAAASTPPSPLSYHNNQSQRYREVPLTQVGMSAPPMENSIKSGNYRAGGADAFSSTLPRERYDYAAPLLPPQQPPPPPPPPLPAMSEDRVVESAPHHRSSTTAADNAINIGEMTTINPIYSQHSSSPPSYLPHNQPPPQPLESSVCASRALDANPLITPDPRLSDTDADSEGEQAAGTMHQVWERRVTMLEPAESAGGFVIPKIVVESQVEEKQDSDLQEKTLLTNRENRQNGSESEPLATIYHREQPERPQSSVEYELRTLDDTRISATVTCDAEINSNNSLTRAEAGAINNINDEEGPGSAPSPPPPPPPATAAVLSDKISEIYRKIEKIEGEYYGEKGKIMENFERRLSAASLSDEAKIDAHPMENKSDDADAPESADITVDEQQQQSRADGNHENLIFEEHSQRDTQSNYHLDEAGEQQQQQTYEHTETIFEGDPNSGGMQATSVEQYSYEPSAVQQQQQNYLDNYPEQQHDDYVYSHQQQQQDESEAGNYNQPYNQPLDSNYQQQQSDNYESTGDYANSGETTSAVYYDYDAPSQHYAPPTDAPLYDDPNYSHQQPVEYQSGGGGGVVDAEASQASEYSYQQDAAAYHQDRSNESNYRASEENFIETSNEMNASYGTNEYQEYQSTTTDGSYSNTHLPTESESYDTQQQQHLVEEEGEGEEGFVQPVTTEDESYQTTTTITSGDDASTSASASRGNELIEGGESAVPASTKRDDVKLVKQLLDSESDDTTSRSNLLKTAIKEEADESDFDFSTN